MKISRLISEELISVKPLDPPSGIFNYVDYIYNTETEEQKRRRESLEKLEEMFEKIGLEDLI